MSRLAEARHDYDRAGTVDKFQGQEAAVAFYSMATSSGEEMPRDMESLFERNRNPRLLDISCRTAAEMALANLLCAIKERAVTADW